MRLIVELARSTHIEVDHEVAESQTDSGQRPCDLGRYNTSAKSDMAGAQRKRLGLALAANGHHRLVVPAAHTHR